MRGEIVRDGRALAQEYAWNSPHHVSLALLIEMSGMDGCFYSAAPAPALECRC